MKQVDLSIVIPARNEMFLKQTVENILENIRGNTEIIVIADGGWPVEPLDDNQRVHMIYHPESIGQRASTNEGACLSTAKYIMKADAHCAFDEGFDVKMMAECQPNWTLIPRMYNLHAFNWRCKKCGNETYQGKTPESCEKCDNTTEFERVIVWKEKRNPTSDFMRFDSDLHFQYWREFKERPEAQADVAPTMSLIGACWMMERDRYWELEGMDERHGSWGQMGTEIACKSWLSGGALMTNKKTWFAHMFRTAGGDFGFPYPNPGIKKCRKYSQDMWFNNKWHKQKYPLKWLIDKFSPVPGWEDYQWKETKEFSHGANNNDVILHSVDNSVPDSRDENRAGNRKKTKGIVYYTDNRAPKDIHSVVRQSLLKARANGISHVVTSGISEKPDFGDFSFYMPEFERCYLTMFKQMLAGIENCHADIIFLCEHDVIYHPSHFNFTPCRDDVYCYNENVYQINTETGKTVYWRAKRASQLCAFRDLLVEHYRKRVAIVEEQGFTMRMGFEPGTHRRAERVDDYGSESWISPYPNLDLKHGKNLTRAKWSPLDFRNKKNCIEWKDVKDEIPGWGKPQNRFKEFLNGCTDALS